MNDVFSFFKELIAKEYFPTYYSLDKLLKIQLEEIEIVKIDCFHTHDLERFNSFLTYNRQNEDIATLIRSIVKNDEPANIKFDLRKLTNVSSSKSLSWGYSFDTMYSFGRNLINVVDIVNIHKDRTFSSIESCFQNMRCNDEFVFRIDHVLWENRYVWLNNDGSHHCATAIFYAENQHKELVVNASLSTQSLNEEVINELNQHYKIFVISAKKYYELQNSLSLYSPIYIEPIQGQDILLIFEKNKSKVPKIILRFLESYDQRYIFDFNRHLLALLKKQKRVEAIR